MNFAPQTALNRMAAVSPAGAMSMANSRLSGINPGMRRMGLGLGRLPVMNAPRPQPDVGRASVNEVENALAQQQQHESVGTKLAELLDTRQVRIQRFEDEHRPAQSEKLLPALGQAGSRKSSRSFDFAAPFRSMRSQRA
jgi:hypothetical protein